MSYKHFTINDREKLAIYKAEGKSNTQIALLLNKHKSSIGKELKRNSTEVRKDYYGIIAHEKSLERRKKAKKSFNKINQEMLFEIKQRLEINQSPDQIVGRMKIENKEICSHETIYQMIYQNYEGMSIFSKYLRRKKRKRRNRSLKREKRGIIRNRIGIENRPEIKGKGHWEGDTVIGRNHKGAIATFVDKQSKFLIAQLIEDKSSQLMNKACIEIFRGVIHLKTFTFDNGKEFAGHEELKERLGVDCYFANPYHSWERGLNEHTNGLLREYFPKKTDFKELSNEEVQNAVYLINRRPRKALAYRTPYEVFFSNSDSFESIPVALQI